MTYEILQSYYRPEQKVRDSDTHGGFMLYVKEGLHYKRRDDLELQNIENIWIELANSHKRILLGLFYLPPNSDAAYLAHIDAAYLAHFHWQSIQAFLN